jgi:serum/glucocorticoid-regulated kinase 2
MRQQNNVFNERDLMLSLIECDFVCSLYSTLQDNKKLYFIQQYVYGEDLWTLLYSKKISCTKLGGMPLKSAMFYFSNVLTILEQIHELEIVYRDFKPENLVFNYDFFFLDSF